MRPSASAAAWWLCVALAAVSSSEIVYKKLGDTVVFTPNSGPGPIKSITWNYGTDLAVMWNPSSNIIYFPRFRGRSSLNTSNGQITITVLTQKDSGMYTAEIDNKHTSFNLKVFSAVPVPTISQSCDDEKSSCTLTCDGDTTGAEPVTYTWKSDDTVIANSSARQHEITKDSLDIKQFSCELKNPVSQEDSEPIPNPLLTDPSGVNPRIITGIIVFVCLLVCLLLLVFIHRCKAGAWFYEKDSLPCEGDFWSKENTSQDQDTAAHQKKHKDEETLMTQPNKP